MAGSTTGADGKLVEALLDVDALRPSRSPAVDWQPLLRPRPGRVYLGVGSRYRRKAVRVAVADVDPERLRVDEDAVVRQLRTGEPLAMSDRFHLDRLPPHLQDYVQRQVFTPDVLTADVDVSLGEWVEAQGPDLPQDVLASIGHGSVCYEAPVPHDALVPCLEDMDVASAITDAREERLPAGIRTPRIWACRPRPLTS